MSGPYEESKPPFGLPKFTCQLCGYQTLTKMGMWEHLDKKHPEVNKVEKKSQ